ncbi:MAG: hypothetical protein MI739_04185 [Bacteroidales bacterium]|nr:hypothetical protein [Bacteroidales bacterium]
MKFRLIILLIFILTVNSCKNEQPKDIINEGYIEYNIEYLDDSLDRFMVGLLPKKMIIRFKDNNTINKIEGFSGIISFTHIQNYNEQKNITLIRILNKKYKYIEEINDQSLFFEELPGMKIEFKDSVKQIYGLSAQMAHITGSNLKTKPFDVFYTNDIVIDNVNALTPFKSIDGVLLEFQIRFYNMNMRLTINKIQATAISTNEFNIPEGYERINKKTMKEIIELLKQ